MSKSLALSYLAPRKLAMALIRLYQAAISPWLTGCFRFVPSCSEYALEAYARHGVWRGTLLTFTRIMRCHPGCRGGHDPVP